MNLETIECAKFIHDGVDILDFKGKDFKNLEEKDWLQFAKANKSFGEPGISSEELVTLHQIVELKKGPITIVETGMCYGVTTRYFVVRNLKYGGELWTFETQIKEKFKSAMEDLGLWDKIHVLGHTMREPWNKDIDFLFIDSEHALSDALGEYMRFRVWLKGESIVGFHDSDNCWGVKRAIEIVNEIDDLELIGEATGRLSAGIKFFKVKGMGQKQALTNKQHQDAERKRIQEFQLRVA